MPLKIIIPVVLIVGAAGVAVFENEDLRQQIQEFVSNARRKIAESLHSLAENVSPREEIPLSGRRGSSSTASSSSENTMADTTGRGPWFSGGAATELRQRGGPTFNTFLPPHEQPQRTASGSHSPATAIAAAAVSGAVAAAVVHSSRRSSTTTTQTPVTANCELDTEVEPESGYESQAPAAAVENPFENAQPFWSITEWAENAENASVVSTPSLAGSAAEDVGQVHSDDEESADLHSVSSWTEVGSDTSDGM